MNTNDPLQDAQGSSSIVTAPTFQNAVNIPGANVSNPQLSLSKNELTNLPSLTSIPSSDLLVHPLNSSSSSASTFEKTLSATSSYADSVDSQRKSSNEDNNASAIVQLARRRRSSKSKEKQQRKNSALSRPQGRPLSKETRIRLTLVPTLGILYSILVSDTMRKTLKVLNYSDEENGMLLTNEELSTRNVISGFSSLLNVKTARFSEDGLSYSPEKNANIPKFASIDEAVYNLFGLNDYTLIRVSRAAATEVGGSVLLKIETAMPGYLYLNDDEDEDYKTVVENKAMYLEAIGSKGDRPSTTFLKKKVARPRYKSDMRIYLIPRINSCAIYCEKRMFKRDLLRGFLNMNKLDRSIIVAFNYQEAIEELEKEGYGDLIKEMKLPTVEEFNRSAHVPHSSNYPMSSVGLSISKQSEIQHLQHLQQQQQQQQQQLNHVPPPPPHQQLYSGYSIQRPNEAPPFYDPAQPQPQLSYGFPQQSPSQIYQLPHHPQQPSSQANLFPQYNSYTYSQEVEPNQQPATQPGFSSMDQQFVQQPMEEMVGAHDPNRRINSQSVSYFNQQQMFPSQVMNPYSNIPHGQHFVNPATAAPTATATAQSFPPAQDASGQYYQ